MNTFPIYNFRPTALTVDTNMHNYFEDQGNVLDGSILEPSSIDSGLGISPPVNGSRRESFAASKVPFFSSKAEDWQQIEMQPNPSRNPSFLEHNTNEINTSGNNNNNTNQKIENNHFVHLGPQATVFSHPSQWSSEAEPRMSDAMQINGMVSTCDVNTPIFPRQIQTSLPTSTSPQITLLSPISAGSIGASPQENWSPDIISRHGTPKHMRPYSPILRSHFGMSRRGVGIRKKNTRFEIPAERNLNNIDQLIATSTDEQEIKELKQQKRLLRNRQAALDSRQRKKQHTVRLEQSEKRYKFKIKELEEELARAKRTCDDLLRKLKHTNIDDFLHKHTHKHTQFRQFLTNVQIENDDMAQSHIMKSGGLRKKVTVFNDHVQNLELSREVHVSGPLTSPSFLSDYIDIDDMAIDSGWNHVSFINDAEPEIKMENSPTSIKNNNSLLMSDSDRPTVQGLLLLLLLFGAFVASKGSVPSIPLMSDDVRAASATLLEDIFHDAGVPSLTPDISEVPTPRHSDKSWFASPVESIQESELPEPDQSPLSTAMDIFIKPTDERVDEEADEQLFSLSAEPYDSLTTPNLRDHASQKPRSHGRRSFCEALAEIRNSSPESTAAEAYTRSLFTGQVPTEVVRNFARMIAECNLEGTKNEF